MASPRTEDSLNRLVELSHSGDQMAQGRLIEEIGDSVRAAARRTVGNPQDLEDLTQNIFLAVFRGLSSFRGESHFRAWLATVARNEGRKFLRTRMRRELPVQDAERDPDLVAGPSWADRVQSRHLHQALDRLSADDREALEKVVFDGLSYADAALHLGCSAGSIRGRVYRARRELRRFLEES